MLLAWQLLKETHVSFSIMNEKQNQANCTLCALFFLHFEQVGGYLLGILTTAHGTQLESDVRACIRVKTKQIDKLYYVRTNTKEDLQTKTTLIFVRS